MSASKTTRRFRLTFGKISVLTAAFSALIGITLAYLAYRWFESEFPDVSRLKSEYAVVEYLGPKKPFTVKLVGKRPPGWVGIDQVSRSAMGAVVVSEDWAYFSHPGYDANQLKEVILEDLAERRLSRGASTITMQVVKNVFLTQEKTLYRKGKEFILAIRLNQAVPKKRVLETYFNIAEWGEGIFGIGPAARFYFDKAPSELTAREGAFLAMLLPSPKRYSQSFRDRALTKYAEKTVHSILDKMVKAAYLTEEEAESAKAERMSFERSAPGSSEENDALISDENGIDEIPTLDPEESAE